MTLNFEIFYKVYMWGWWGGGQHVGAGAEEPQGPLQGGEGCHHSQEYTQKNYVGTDLHHQVFKASGADNKTTLEGSWSTVDTNWRSISSFTMSIHILSILIWSCSVHLSSHRIIWSYSHLVIRSSSHLFIQSSDHPAILSSNLVIWSSPFIRSSIHYII